jgi:hypothetical protein
MAMAADYDAKAAAREPTTEVRAASPPADEL